MLPGEWNEKLTSFQKLLVYKALRPDILIALIKKYISKSLSE